jgi:hypothetical protein
MIFEYISGNIKISVMKKKLSDKKEIEVLFFKTIEEAIDINQDAQSEASNIPKILISPDVIAGRQKIKKGKNIYKTSFLIKLSSYMLKIRQISNYY